MADELRLILYRSNRVEALLDCLVERLREAPPDPLAAECIVVPSRGMATWLGQGLADRLGVWANPDFPHPRRFIERILQAALGPDLRPVAGSVLSSPASISPLAPSVPPVTGFTPGLFSRELLGLAIFDLLPTLMARREFFPLRRYLADANDLKALQLAERIAYVFDQYAVYRFAMVMAWEDGAGGDVVPPVDPAADSLVASGAAKNDRGDFCPIGPTGRGGLFAAGQTTESDCSLVGGSASENRWQPLLWRELVARLGSPVRLLREAWRRLRAGTLAAPELLPRRVFLFGITALPPLYLGLLNEVAKLIPGHLLVFSPTQDYWADTNSPQALNRLLLRYESAATNPKALHLAVGHPLLASLGTAGRDFQEIIEEYAECLHPPDGERFVAPELGASGLLARLQGDIFALRRPLVQARTIADDSIVIHSCHSPLREVEVLQDQVLAMLDDGKLKPRDIVVMVPDIETYAPLIAAVFGRSPQDRRYIPFRIADRRISREAPLLDALLTLFELVRGRLPASQVLDFLAREPVGRGFNLDREQVGRIAQWVNRCGIRWGIDEEHRRSHGQPPDPQNTWRFGLDRLIIGYAVDGKGQQLVADILPHDDIEGQDSLSAGILLKFATKLFALAREVRTPRSPAHWAELIQRALVTFFAVDSRAVAGEDWQKQSLHEALVAVVQDSDQAGLGRTLELPAFLHLLRSRLNEAGSTAGFLDGGLTFCAMLPMRTIPFAVICLLGMNDGAFPRRETHSGFDLVANDPRPGDRSRRHDDRYLFLESLLAARRKLYISYVGYSLKDHRRLPPAVPVNELLDCLALMTATESEVEARAGAGVGAGSEHEAGDEANVAQCELARRQFVVEHPLQPFSPRYFQAGAGPLFTFATEYADFAVNGDTDLPPCPLPGPWPSPQVFNLESPSCKRLQSPLVPSPFIPPSPFVAEKSLSLFATDERVALDLAGLHAFFRNPSSWYARHCLHVTMPLPDETPADREPLFIDGLVKHRIGMLLLQNPKTLGAHHDGGSAGGSAMLRLFRARGDLPLAGSAQPALEEISTALEPMAVFLASQPAGKALPSLSIDLDLDSGIHLTGELSQRFDSGLLRYTAGKTSPSFLLTAWLDHLALCAQAPDNQDRQCITISRADKGADIYIFRELSPTRAWTLLRTLADLWQRGRQAALPFFRYSSHAYVYKMVFGRAKDQATRCLVARQAALEAYHGSGYDRWPPPDGADPYVRAMFQGANPAWSWSAQKDPAAPGGGSWEDFIAVAHQVYEPMLQARERLLR
ncbi:MAG: exodeoxyribonuclease V subunit gamma [Desulfobulbaceae bacterium]|nr:MAG: exodeoxyribonuclease V subunit gamma [Desulfobulbaceae bacterium]